MLRQVTMAVTLLTAAVPATAQETPQAALAGLLAAERSLSAAAEKLSPADGIASLIAPDGVLLTRPAPVTGPAAAAAALKGNPANAGNYARWLSVRQGISADGQHGYTVGYL